MLAVMNVSLGTTQDLIAVMLPWVPTRAGPLKSLVSVCGTVGVAAVFQRVRDFALSYFRDLGFVTVRVWPDHEEEDASHLPARPLEDEEDDEAVQHVVPLGVALHDVRAESEAEFASTFATPITATAERWSRLQHPVLVSRVLMAYRYFKQARPGQVIFAGWRCLLLRRESCEGVGHGQRRQKGHEIAERSAISLVCGRNVARQGNVSGGPRRL